MTKLGLGLYQNRRELAADANLIKARAVLLFERALDVVDSIDPSIEVIGRGYWSTQDQDDLLLSASLDDLPTLGRIYAESFIRLWPQVQCWQGLNEVMRARNLDWLKRQVAFEMGFAGACQSLGRKVCVLNAPPGAEPTPESELELFPIYAATIKPLFEHPAVAYWGRHVYTPHRTAHLWDDPDWYALRHRKIVAGLRALGVRVPPIVITELGWADGWRNTGFSDYQAADDLDWFTDQITDDPDIHSVHVFCAGDSGGWADHDIHGTGIIGRMAAWNARHPNTEITPEVPTMAMDEATQQAMIEMEARQNSILTRALIHLRQGQFTGPDSLDGDIVTLNGGKLPDGYKPVFPKV